MKKLAPISLSKNLFLTIGKHDKIVIKKFDNDDSKHLVHILFSYILVHTLDKKGLKILYLLNKKNIKVIENLSRFDNFKCQKAVFNSYSGKIPNIKFNTNYDYIFLNIDNLSKPAFKKIIKLNKLKNKNVIFVTNYSNIKFTSRSKQILNVSGSRICFEHARGPIVTAKISYLLDKPKIFETDFWDKIILKSKEWFDSNNKWEDNNSNPYYLLYFNMLKNDPPLARESIRNIHEQFLADHFETKYLIKEKYLRDFIDCNLNPNNNKQIMENFSNSISIRNIVNTITIDEWTRILVNMDENEFLNINLNRIPTQCFQIIKKRLSLIRHKNIQILRAINSIKIPTYSSSKRSYPYKKDMLIGTYKDGTTYFKGANKWGLPRNQRWDKGIKRWRRK